MKYFTKLFTELDQTTKTLGKIKALMDYFEHASDQDKLWTIAILSHRRPKRSVNATFLAEWARELSGLPEWIFYESYTVVGDLAETITLVLPSEFEQSDFTLTYWIDYIKSLDQYDIPEKKEKILHAWHVLNEAERFVFNKLLTGSFRIGVSQSGSWAR